VADADAIDVGFLDVGAHPQVVRVDQRHDGLAGYHDLADARGTHVDDTVDRRAQLGVAKAHAGFRVHRGRRDLLLLIGLELVAANRDLIRVRSGELDGRALR